jgi:hypothetical protein
MARTVPKSPEQLMRDAAETLFYIKAICLHNNFDFVYENGNRPETPVNTEEGDDTYNPSNKGKRGVRRKHTNKGKRGVSRKPTNEKNLELLCNAWLYTNTLKAATLCKGVQNPEFYTLYSKLMNLSKHGGVCIWGTKPYL